MLTQRGEAFENLTTAALGPSSLGSAKVNTFVMILPVPIYNLKYYRLMKRNKKKVKDLFTWPICENQIKMHRYFKKKRDRKQRYFSFCTLIKLSLFATGIWLSHLFILVDGTCSQMNSWWVSSPVWLTKLLLCVRASLQTITSFSIAGSEILNF